MKLPLEIVIRDMLPLPSLGREIGRRAAKLEQFGGELSSCRVVVEATANRRRQGHEYLVTIDVHLPQAEVAVSQHHRGNDVQRTLHAAFDAMDRRLDELQSRRSEAARRVPGRG